MPNSIDSFNPFIYDTPVSTGYFKGFITNFRITTGQALYTGNFTPPSSTLTTTSVGTTGPNVAASINPGSSIFLAFTDNQLTKNSGNANIVLTSFGSPIVQNIKTGLTYTQPIVTAIETTTVPMQYIEKFAPGDVIKVFLANNSFTATANVISVNNNSLTFATPPDFPAYFAGNMFVQNLTTSIFPTAQVNLTDWTAAQTSRELLVASSIPNNKNTVRYAIDRNLGEQQVITSPLQSTLTPYDSLTIPGDYRIRILGQSTDIKANVVSSYIDDTDIVSSYQIPSPPTTFYFGRLDANPFPAGSNIRIIDGVTGLSVTSQVIASSVDFVTANVSVQLTGNLYIERDRGLVYPKELVRPIGRPINSPELLWYATYFRSYTQDRSTIPIIVDAGIKFYANTSGNISQFIDFANIRLTSTGNITVPNQAYFLSVAAPGLRGKPYLNNPAYRTEHIRPIIPYNDIISDLADMGRLGQTVYTVPGTYSWQAPLGVFNISVVAVGGGGGGSNYSDGGGGGGLAWANLPVVPGQSYTLRVGAGGAGGAGTSEVNGSTGGDSWFGSNTTVVGLGGIGGGLPGRNVTVTYPAAGQQQFTLPGTYEWTCPVGITSVSVLAIGGGGSGDGNGGGGGGGLGYKNNITVVPGTVYTVRVGEGGNFGRSGNASFFISTSVVAGLGGSGGSTRTGGAYVGDGGGLGGNGGLGGAGGGGGAGGYTGTGGLGGAGNWIQNSLTQPGGSGSGGGGGGGGGAYNQYGNGNGVFPGGGGGGVGIYGPGANGAGGYSVYSLWGTDGGGGGGGSGGNAGSNGGGDFFWQVQDPGGRGGGFGGGGGGPVDGSSVSIAGSGAVRIIWGSERAWPSTGIEDVTNIPLATTVIVGVKNAGGEFITNATGGGGNGGNGGTWNGLGFPGGAGGGGAGGYSLPGGNGGQGGTVSGTLATGATGSEFFGYSYSFDGTGDGINCGTQSIFALGTGAFCLEGWIYNNALKNYSMLWTTRPDNGNYADAYHIGWDGVGGVSLYVGSATVVAGPAGTIKVFRWQHIAVVRNAANTVALFVDGVRISVLTGYTNNFTRTLLGLGDFPTTKAESINGYISNARIVVGSPVYDPDSSGFQVPTSPLTAIAGTVILTAQTLSIVDRSIYNLTLTAQGNATTSTLTPFVINPAIAGGGGGGGAGAIGSLFFYNYTGAAGGGGGGVGIFGIGNRGSAGALSVLGPITPVYETVTYLTTGTVNLVSPLEYYEGNNAALAVAGYNWVPNTTFFMTEMGTLGPTTAHGHVPSTWFYFFANTLPQHTQVRYSFYWHFVDSVDNETSLFDVDGVRYLQFTKVWNVAGASGTTINLCSSNSANGGNFTWKTVNNYSYAPWGGNRGDGANGYFYVDTGWINHTTANITLAHFIGPDQAATDEASYISHVRLQTRLTTATVSYNEVNMYRSSAGDAWDAQAYSSQGFTAPCTIEFNKNSGGPGDNGQGYAMIGWNTDPTTNASYDTIDYAAYPYRSDIFSIHHNGSQIFFSGSFNPANKFYIVYDTDGYIRHYNGSTLLYTSPFYGTSNTVYFDTSLYSGNQVYGSFNNVKIVKNSWNGTNYIGRIGPTGGTGGSGGTAGGNGQGFTDFAVPRNGANGGTYGGGGSAGSTPGTASNYFVSGGSGGGGAVRIIYGTNVSYPSTANISLTTGNSIIRQSNYISSGQLTTGRDLLYFAQLVPGLKGVISITTPRGELRGRDLQPFDQQPNISRTLGRVELFGYFKRNPKLNEVFEILPINIKFAFVDKILEKASGWTEITNTIGKYFESKETLREFIIKWFDPAQAVPFLRQLAKVIDPNARLVQGNLERRTLFNTINQGFIGITLAVSRGRIELLRMPGGFVRDPSERKKDPVTFWS